MNAVDIDDSKDKSMVACDLFHPFSSNHFLISFVIFNCIFLYAVSEIRWT